MKSIEQFPPTGPAERPSSPENVEQEISPEVLEKIMQKVQDIEKYGTGFTGTDYEGLEGILSAGLLPIHDVATGRHGKEGKVDIEKIKKTWVKRVLGKGKDKKWGKINFNIVGRVYSGYGPTGTTDIGKNPFVQRRYAVIFDLSSFKERDGGELDLDYGSLVHSAQLRLSNNKDPDLNENELLKPLEPNEYVIHDSAKVEDGVKKSRDMEGFTAAYRIAPKHFRGVVLGTYKGDRKVYETIVDKEYNSSTTRTKHVREDFTDEEMRSRADDVVKMMTEMNKDTPEKNLPVYDDRGNLMWPKRMSHEEVKEYAESLKETNGNP